MTRLVSRGETPEAARTGEDDGLLVSIKEGGGEREEREGQRALSSSVKSLHLGVRIGEGQRINKTSKNDVAFYEQRDKKSS